MMMLLFRKPNLAALLAATIAVPGVASLKEFDLTCDYSSQVVSQGGCLTTALNAYFGLEGSTELACQLYDPKNQWHLYLDKKTRGTSSTFLGQITTAINKNPNYDGVKLAAKRAPTGIFLLATTEADADGCLEAMGILRQLLTESCSLNTATGALTVTA